MITIAIAEDHQSLIDGIKLLLEFEEDIQIVGEANNGEDLLQIVRSKQPNIVLTDIRMPKMDGITAAKIIRKEFPECRIIAFSMFEQDEAVQQMIDTGASAYITKNSSLKLLLTAIKAVANNETYFEADIKKSEHRDTTNSPISPREKEILELIAQGKTSQEIAEQLFIGKSTVDSHRKNLLRKLNLQGKSELLRYAMDKKYKF
ncbi:response regulator [Flavobacterium kingsejongi]|uniref:DNA-binding response regulator n=1 Tax=Flavobacterium kingsejongi TaxID=1678728 RepID=A0A2S1LQ45_9FLAO|nr:response regulator transcription factor [Flavobacterium kingsejongi]AWG25864.1 DNA-binding response regulator [Flavobacterium kingsejongi]